MKIGSLFDGSGTAPLAATMCGMDVAWISEIEPYPCRVTAARFPGVPNHGDITKMDGGKIEPVDVIVGGSPCQDLSVAGSQKGLTAGTRSHLFYDMVRIIDEMREATNGAYPRYVIWENVPGAFSSNNGEDFRAVIKNLCQIADPRAFIPRPHHGWANAGAVVGNGYSLAWRVLDAQYWRVPQRRRRIYLVFDLGGQRAGEILFKRPGLRRDTEESGEAGKGTASDAAGGVGGSCIAFKERAGKPGGKGILPAVGRSSTLATNVDQSVVYEPKSLMEENWAAQDVKNALRANGSKSGSCVVERIDESGVIGLTNRGYVSGDKAETLRAGSHMALPCVVLYGVDCRNGTLTEEKTHTIQAKANGGISLNCTPSVCYAIKGNYIDRDTKQNGGGWREGEMYTLDATDRHGVCVLNDQGGQVMSVSDKAGCLQAQEHWHQSVVCYDARGNGDGDVCPTMTGDHNGHVSDYTTLITERCRSMSEYVMDEKASILKQRDYKGGGVDVVLVKSNRKYIVRRLTPLECCRLQGFPDWWEDGVEGSDTARYKMWGNGMALPNMLYVLEGIRE